MEIVYLNVSFMKLQCPQRTKPTLTLGQLKVILNAGTRTIHYQFVQKDANTALSGEIIFVIT